MRAIGYICYTVVCAGLVVVVAGCAHGKASSQKAATSTPKVISLDFEDMPVGQLPAEFAATQTHGGEPPRWLVQEDPDAASGRKVLAQLDADTTRVRFPLCVYQGLKARDLDVSVQYKPLSGKVDESGGIVFRFQDRDNYYVFRANAIEDNFRFYKVQGGKRTQLATVKMQTTAGQWHTLRVKAVGDHFQIYHDGSRKLDVVDDTFGEAGKVGLWTKADSVTYFDDLKIAVLD